MLRKRLFLVADKAVLWCGKGCFAVRKRLFRVAEKAFRGRRRVGGVWLCGVCGWLSDGCLKCGKSRICGRSYYVSVLKHSRGVVVGCFFSFLRNDSVLRSLRRRILVWVSWRSSA